MATGRIIENTSEPLVAELCVIPFSGVFAYVESSSVQGQDNMLKIM